MEVLRVFFPRARNHSSSLQWSDRMNNIKLNKLPDCWKLLKGNKENASWGDKDKFTHDIVWIELIYLLQ